MRDKQTQWAFDHPKRILMSVWCKSTQIEFVGVSLFSPAYEEKARRLLGSCNLKGVCCKATMVSSDFMGASTPEGTDQFRYRMIALKPLFLLDQMEKTLEPVVFLDVRQRVEAAGLWWWWWWWCHSSQAWPPLGLTLQPLGCATH